MKKRNIKCSMLNSQQDNRTDKNICSASKEILSNKFLSYK